MDFFTITTGYEFKEGETIVSAMTRQKYKVIKSEYKNGNYTLTVKPVLTWWQKVKLLFTKLFTKIKLYITTKN